MRFNIGDSGRCLALVVLVTLTGCGGVPDQPPLGTVTGIITLGGKPLEFRVVDASLLTASIIMSVEVIHWLNAFSIRQTETQT